MKLLNPLVLTSLLFVSQFAAANQPTAAQIEQFKKLPKAQQEQLARQYGVDLSSLNRSSAAEPAVTAITEPQMTVTPAEAEPVKESVDVQDNRLPTFGYDVLKGSPSSFTTLDNVPVPNDYVLGPGDEVRIQIFGKEDQQYSVVVDRNGQLNLPKIGPISVTGKSFQDLDSELTALIKERTIGVNVTVSMGSMRMMQIYVTGEATMPGAYNVNGLTTITQALIAAGGVKNTGSLREVQLKRKGQTVAKLDLYQLLLKGDTSQDVRLQKGDTLFIPSKKSNITISGEVTRPAHFELTAATPLSTVVEYAGGTLNTAYLSSVTVRRQTQQGIVVDTVDLTQPAGQQYRVKDGDEIFISKASNNIVDAVAVRGQVTKQGVHEYKKGMRISDVLSSLDDDLLPSADLSYALIVRERTPHGKIDVLQLNLREAVTKPGSQADLILANRDQIFVLSNNYDADFWLGKGAQKRSALDQKRDTDEKVGTSAGQANTSRASTLADNETLTLRERELKPILQRLKEQSSWKEPAQIVQIVGEVKFPGTYPITENMTVADLVQAAGGFMESAYLDGVEMTRFDPKTEDETKLLDKLKLNLSSLSTSDAQRKLVSKDRIAVLKNTAWRSEMVVQLSGEVMYPGTYAINRGDTILDVIERAGGLTDYAYANGAIFSRETLKERERKQMAHLQSTLESQIAGLTLRKNSSSASFSSSPSEAMALVQNLADTPALGRMVIDLPAILEGNQEANIMLANNDKLYIPEFDKSVSIIGEVQFTSTHTFDYSKTVDDYIQLAGGTKKQADTDRVYVVRADGSVMLPNNSFWFSRSSESLQPGDTIIVPIDVDYLDGLSTVTSATQILYQLGVAWSAIKD